MGGVDIVVQTTLPGQSCEGEIGNLNTLINQTIHSALKCLAATNPDSIAILAPGRSPLSFRSLWLHVEGIIQKLNTFGIGRNDRVAIVLPNGPELATAFLGVASGATSAPLNPSYRAGEFDFYLSDLNARALIIQSDLDSPARDIAKKRSISVIDLSFGLEEPAGLFSLAGNKQIPVPAGVFAEPNDVALILHTSGTTSRPKIVPLTHKNICTSAHNTKKTLELTEKDRCLNVMPLFHIHGLVAGILSSLTAGSSVVCTPGFRADQFYEWLQSFHPTWYTAVPSMHQAVLARVEVNRQVVEKFPLRFIRSSSMSLPPQVMKKLEQAFHAPVIEAYGMTEASHQVTSNLLPPRQRKPGTVGVPAGPEVNIVDEAFSFLPVGQPGEIVIRGENVTPGYENNPVANQNGFMNGWFRTGDQGVIDKDDYLSITGRLKEIVNRGGEKVTPREVDEVLMDHPDVMQAVAFAVPHPTLGEDLAAAVVMRENSMITEKELRQFAFASLADYKVPSQIVFVEEIPKGPTGKVQRIGLYETLRSNFKADYAGPRNSLQEEFARIWAEILGLKRVGIYDNFFALGGDSLFGVSVLLEMEKIVNKELNPAILFQAPTIDQLSSLLEGDQSENKSYLVPVQSSGTGTPFFCVPGHGGDVFTFVHLARHLQPERPVYVFRFPEPAKENNKVANSMFMEMAAAYIEEMRAQQPDGPYLLGGFCFGGELALEMARQLRLQGQRVDFLAIIYAYLPGSVRAPGFLTRVRYHVKNFLKSTPEKKAAYVVKFARNVMERITRRFFPTVTRSLVRTSQNAVSVPLYYPGKIDP